MPETPYLRDASPDEIADGLAFTLRYNRPKRIHHADEVAGADRGVRSNFEPNFVLNGATVHPDDVALSFRGTLLQTMRRKPAIP
jgi:hypothetical protein